MLAGSSEETFATVSALRARTAMERSLASLAADPNSAHGFLARLQSLSTTARAEESKLLCEAVLGLESSTQEAVCRSIEAGLLAVAESESQALKADIVAAAADLEYKGRSTLASRLPDIVDAPLARPQRRRDRQPRPLPGPISLLALLHFSFGVILLAIVGLAIAGNQSDIVGIAITAALGLGSWFEAWGLWSLRPWSRRVASILAGIFTAGAFFSLSLAATVLGILWLFYLSSREVRDAFEAIEPGHNSVKAETTNPLPFIVTVVSMEVLLDFPVTRLLLLPILIAAVILGFVALYLLLLVFVYGSALVLPAISIAFFVSSGYVGWRMFR
jgi:hypothetical protein